VQISLFLPTAMEMVGVSPEHFPNEPHLDAYWKHERVSLAPVMAFWVGVGRSVYQTHARVDLSIY
jgi:hypothetical protein